MSFIQLQIRRDTAADWTAADPVLAEGEMGLELDTQKYKVGDGVTAWTLLPYWSGGGGGIPDAPVDGEDYVRSDAQWVIADYFSGDYNDLTNKPSIPFELQDLDDVDPYSAADFGAAPVVNAAGNATQWVKIVSPDGGNILTADTEGGVYWDGSYGDLVGAPVLATVALTGDYNDLINTPAPFVPTTFTGAGTTGYVPDPGAEQGFFLSDDGTFKAASGGGGSNWTLDGDNLYNSNPGGVGIGTGTTIGSQLEIAYPNGKGRTFFDAGNTGFNYFDATGLSVWRSEVGTNQMYIDHTGGTFNLTSLAGTGTRMVVADDFGNVSSQPIPIGGSGHWEEFEAGPTPGARVAIRNIPTVNSDTVCIGDQPDQNIGGNPKLYLRTEVTGNQAELFRMQSSIGYVRCLMSDASATEPRWQNACVFETAQGNDMDFVFSAYLTGSIQFLTGPRATALELDAAQGATFVSLAGADTRMVVANAAGTLSTQPIPGGGGSFWAANGNDIQNTNVGNVNVQGALTATGDVTASFSDERLKQDFRGICNPLDKVNCIDAFTYRPNALAVELGAAESQDERHVGVSAQDVERVLPEVVKPAPFNADYKTVQYERMVPLLLAAIQELTARVEELESQ